MIAEVGAALRGLLAPVLPAGTEIVSTPPTETGAGTETSAGAEAGTQVDRLHVFLVDIREDSRAVAADWQDVRDSDGVVIGRRAPTRRFDLLYLIAAGTPDPQRQGVLIDAVLRAVQPERGIGAELLSGELAEAGAPVRIRFADMAMSTYQGFDLPVRTVVGVIVNAPLAGQLDTGVARAPEEISLDTGRGRRSKRSPRSG